MFTHWDYELLDFGDGRKLERFGPHVLDRPAPQADQPRSDPRLWMDADARFDSPATGRSGTWRGRLQEDHCWMFRANEMQFELRLTASGQVGIFPEQAESWEWLKRVAQSSSGPQKVLNLFGYTGASTLAAAAAGAEVVHVDAAKTAVAWARRNAQHCGLESAPVRWIVDDALTFVRREIRRGNRYDGLILDPPSFGRGPRGQRWQFDEHLEELLVECRHLFSEKPAFCIASCHTTGWSPSLFARRVRKHLQPEKDRSGTDGWLNLPTRSGRTLSSGMFFRWARE